MLERLERSLYVFHHLSDLVELDAMTAAPANSSGGRSYVMEYISSEKYKRFISRETGELLRELMARKSELPARAVRQTEYLTREFDRMKAIPGEAYVAYQKLISEAQSVWVKAKQQNVFDAFAPYLEKIFDTQMRFIDYWDPRHNHKPYDVLLNQYEYGLTSDMLDKFFARLREEIIPLLNAIREKGRQPESGFLNKEYPLSGQRILSEKLIQILTLDRGHCAIAETEHPFTQNFNKDDVRITTHYYPNAPMSSLFSVMHEGGHALYESNTDDDLRWTSLAFGASYSIHESISRFFENIVGRSKGFCSFILPVLQEIFPEQLSGVTADRFYHAVNEVTPSLIRIESDELTYCLHIMVRYEIEKELINRTIHVADLPEIWNAKMKEYLGVDVPDDTRGVLQDSHWSGGLLGYFPTYALGNAYGAQMAERMKQDVDLDGCCARGELKPVVDWLTEHVFRFGCMMDPIPLFEQYCGAKFTPEPYCRYLKEKYNAIYGL